jgi:hypothetical protein
MSDTRQGPDWWLGSDGKWYPPERQSKAPRPAHRKRNDDRASWITGGVIAAVFVISLIALAMTKKSDTTAANSTSTSPSPHVSVGGRGPVTPAPPAGVPPATAALPATSLVLWSGSGSGFQRGPQFTVPPGTKGWNEIWTYNCGRLGRPGTFVTYTRGSGNAPTTAQRGPHSQGMGGTGTDHHTGTGTFWINVNSECGWTDQAETVP